VPPFSLQYPPILAGEGGQTAAEVQPECSADARRLETTGGPAGTPAVMDRNARCVYMSYRIPEAKPDMWRGRESPVVGSAFVVAGRKRSGRRVGCFKQGPGLEGLRMIRPGCVLEVLEH
jgi:hypothetical protein